jgi:hypothetical protein
MFIFTKVGHSKFVEMHRDTSDSYQSASKSDLYFFIKYCDLFIEVFICRQTCVNVNISADKK